MALAALESKPPTVAELLENARANEILYTDPSRLSKLTQHLNNARNAEEFTDVILCAEEESFPCHKVVLAAGSAYFRAVFQHDPEASAKTELELPGLSSLGVEIILNFLYTSQLRINIDNVIDILEVADFLQFRSIVETCSTFLLQHINSENCLEIHLLAESHLCQALAEAAKKHAIAHFDVVCQTEAFLELCQKTLLSYLEIPRLYVRDETILLEGVCNWLTKNEEYQDNVDAYLKYIRFSSISHDVLCSSIIKYSVLHKSAFLPRIEPNPEMKTEEKYDNQENGLSKLWRAETLSTQKGSRPCEVLVLIPRETVSNKGKRKTEILYFCIRENKWKVLTNIPLKDRYLYSVVVHDNVIYVTGGEEYEVPTNSTTRYIVDLDAWEDAPPMLETRANHSSASMGECLYVIGGKGPKEMPLRGDTEEFNPRTGQWSRLPVINGIEGIGRCAAVPLDGRLYIVGGTASSTDSRSGEVTRWQYCAAQFYDPTDKKWHFADRLSDLLKIHGLSVGVGDCMPYKGLILIIHENTKGKRMKLYNPCTGGMSDFIRTHGQHRFGGYVIHRDVLYCVGGVAGMFGANDMVHYHSIAEDDNETGQVWKVLTPLPGPYSHHTCATIYKVLP